MLELVARLAPAAADARRGVVRLHPEVLAALGLRSWDAVTLTGARVTAALAVAGAPGDPHGQARLDDVTLSNAGLTDGATVVVAPAPVTAAREVRLVGSALTTATVAPATLRLALMGKVLVRGDAVSLLPQDIAPAAGSDVRSVRRALAAAVGGTWTSELLTVAVADPAGPVVVTPSTVVGWQGGRDTGDTGDSGDTGGTAPAALGGPGPGGPVRSPASLATATASAAAAGAAPGAVEGPGGPAGSTEPVVPLEDLAANEAVARRLLDWFELMFRRPELLTRLGGDARLGVLVSGPEGAGKATLVRSAAAAAGARCVELVAPAVAAVEPAAAAERVRAAIARARTGGSGATGADGPAVLLVHDAHALLPAADPPPLATLVLDELRAATAPGGPALVVTSAEPEALDPRLRAPDLVDRELSVGLPDTATRRALLERLLADVPRADDVDLGAVAARTPGFVVADLAAVRREAAVSAALRGSGAEPTEQVHQSDLLDAVGSVRPISLSGGGTLGSGGLTLDDVGDMTEVKAALTEAVLWPLRHPDSFARLGVDAPRGVLLYGPPGGGKTFLLRALAGSGDLNVFAVKGAELLDKYVGESERAVRELFRRAAEAAPALIFLDEVDALAPRRGGSTDAGVADRVVAALLTELDGATPLREVVVVGATNRPELIDPAMLRPGRLERLVFVPPPDADARADILRAAGRDVPLADDVDLDALASELDGYSAADCAALLREAALTAMRESLDAGEVTAAHLATARRTVRASLDPAQVAELEAYARRRSDG
ncbi:Cell division protein FtsH [Pseudonocardia sp. Ae406_Ps2]|uniref:AAA family ATPase n=1 Tax=unclassified Pseudonocardia TaxID=2619320 RepID=UPI00094AB696|nr:MULTISPECIES: AAA family ATPase [unclassified Pseudonocardia]OLL97944.1 Cell division protein FtsH [Pseudonocardia sp. Ae331_Ps2]OLM04348.1 Cell division protein FtsH [Pseudonocardia sp. Ae406_Ps2]OLM10815.1 Cell division protein FtsH [Pseudonocardia sp. Ae505_Ps2]OLM25909.1 Cell division protein FtsH [Pseudonocardia sp. Ae706_Ps2]